MKKNIIKIIVGISTIVLVAVILVIINNSYAPKKEPTKDETLYKESKIKQLELKGITTKDKKISIDDTIVYFTSDNGISQIDLEIKSKNTLEDLYLLIEFELDNKVEKKIIYQQNVEKEKEFKYMIQSIEDLTETNSWKVFKINEDEAIANGYVKIED